MKNQNIDYENKYLSAVAKGLKNKNQQKILCDELESHILDKADYYEEIGYNKEEALQKAIEDMGDAEETSIALDNLHNVKWYKQPVNIVVAFLLVCQFVLLIIFHRDLRYTFYGFNIHYIYKDFISLFILLFNSVILYIGYKRKSKAILIAMGITFLSQFYFRPYQPLFWGITKVVASGFSGYINSIFAYEFISKTASRIISLLSVILTGGMWCYCTFSLKEIFDMERGKSKKNHWKYHIVFNKIFTIFICCNFILMTVCTCIAYPNRFEVEKRSEELRGDIVEFLITFDVNANLTYDEALEELYKFYNNYGEKYRVEEQDGFLCFYIDDVSLNIANTSEMFNEDGEDYAIGYMPALPYTNNLKDDNDFIMTENEFYKMVENITVESFLETGLQAKVASMEIDSNNPDEFLLTFKLKDSDFCYADFENGICINVYTYKDEMASLEQNNDGKVPQVIVDEVDN